MHAYMAFMKGHPYVYWWPSVPSIYLGHTAVPYRHSNLLLLECQVIER